MPESTVLTAPPNLDSRSARPARILARRLARVLAPRTVAGRLARTLTLWMRRARTRRELAHLDARLRADIGVTRETARREAAKPFWKA